MREAIEQDGWPRLRDVRGKVLFAMDNTDAHREQYLAGHPSLEGRMLFVSADPASPAAAFLKMNEAVGAAGARIAPLARAGFLIRTRADEPGKEARTGDTTRRDAAFGSGAQFVSTDYPEPSPVRHRLRRTPAGRAVGRGPLQSRDGAAGLRRRLARAALTRVAR